MGGLAQTSIGCNAGGTIGQFNIVKITTAVSGRITVIESSATTDICFGVAQHAAVSGEPVTVVFFGETYVVAGGTVAAGSLVNGDAAGLADNQSTTTESLPVLGTMLEAAVVNDEAKMFVGVGGLVEANVS